MQRNNLTIAAYLLLVFGGGAAVGAFGHRLYTVKSVDATSAPRRKGPEDFRRAYVTEISERLKLTAEQATQVEGVLSKTGEKYRAFRERTRPEMDQIQNEQINAIRALLSETQQAEYEKWRAERDAKRKASGERR